MPNDKEFELDDLESFSFDDLSLDETPPAVEGAAEDDFGVWVKSAPEDVESSDPEELDAPLIADSLPEEDFLSTEELANLDDSFEFVTVEEPLEGETPDTDLVLEPVAALDEELALLDTAVPGETDPSGNDSSHLPSFDEISLDDFVNFDEASPSEVPTTPTFATPTLEAASADEDFGEEFLDIDIDIDDEINDEELEIVEGAQPKAAVEPAPVKDDFPAQEVDLAEFGDFEEVVPAGALGESEDLPEVKDVPEMPSLDDDSLLDDGFFEEEVFAEPMAALVDEGPVSLDLEPDDQTDMNHILALEEDLTSGIRPSTEQESEPEPAKPVEASSDVAARILGKIEQELSSLKQEISELKKEVTQLRAAPRDEAPVPLPEALGDEPAPEAAEEAPKSHGFFDEEDDETIALTGDELDNILSTAEISEGEELGVSPDDDLLSLDPEGNLVGMETAEPVQEHEAVHVTDEEFLAGTALADDDIPGVPESIELEESLPLGLDSDETEDLLSEPDMNFDDELVDNELAGDELVVDKPVVEEEAEAPQPTFELPAEEEVGLELADAGALAPDLEEEAPVPEEASFEAPQADSDADADGWSPPPAEPTPVPPPVTMAPTPVPSSEEAPAASGAMSPGLKDELRAVLAYMDKLLASLPDDKIQEFAESDHFEVYKRLFEELGLIE